MLIGVVGCAAGNVQPASSAKIDIAQVPVGWTDAEPQSDVDPAAVQRFMLGTVFPALGQVGQNPDALRELLTQDVRLRWPNKVADGPDAFVKTTAGAFADDVRRFVIAATNYKLLVTKCRSTDPSLRPVGLPASVDIATFDPTHIDARTIAAHPGLLAPSVQPIKMIQGERSAANRFLNVAQFKHSWFTTGQPAYTYVDRYVVVREAGELKVQEYEFTYNAGEFPPEPVPLTSCPR
jgi:hypothetical protein